MTQNYDFSILLTLLRYFILSSKLLFVMFNDYCLSNLSNFSNFSLLFYASLSFFFSTTSLSNLHFNQFYSCFIYSQTLICFSSCFPQSTHSQVTSFKYTYKLPILSFIAQISLVDIELIHYPTI